MIYSFCVFTVVQSAWTSEDSNHSSWSYEGESGPDSWPHLPVGKSNQCGMRQQSPIDIEVLNTLFDRSMKPLDIRGHDQLTSNISLTNNGHTSKLNAFSPSKGRSKERERERERDVWKYSLNIIF